MRARVRLPHCQRGYLQSLSACVNRHSLVHGRPTCTPPGRWRSVCAIARCSVSKLIWAAATKPLCCVLPPPVIGLAVVVFAGVMGPLSVRASRCRVTIGRMPRGAALLRGRCVTCGAWGAGGVQYAVTATPDRGASPARRFIVAALRQRGASSARRYLGTALPRHGDACGSGAIIARRHYRTARGGRAGVTWRSAAG